MKTYVFKVVLEQGEWEDAPDEKAIWRATIPAFKHKAVVAWGNNVNHALLKAGEAAEMVVDELVESEEPIPEMPEGEVTVFDEPRICVTVQSIQEEIEEDLDTMRRLTEKHGLHGTGEQEKSEQ